MNKTKRLVCLALALALMAAAALTGCKTVKASSSTAPTKLTWFLVGPGQEPDTDFVLSKVNEYLKDKLNVEIDLTVLAYGDSYNNKVNTMLAAGDAFDICFTAGWAADIKMNAANGYFTVLDEYLEKDPIIINVVGRDFMNGIKINGKTYAVPCNKEQVHNWGFLLKKDLVDKYQVPVQEIKSMEDLEPYYDRIKAEEPGVIPLLTVEQEAPFKLLDWDNFSDDSIPGALYPDNRNTNVINQWLAPESIDYYHKMRQYAEKGYISADAATMTNFNDQLKTGKYFACVQSLKPGKDAEMKASTDGIDWVQVDITRPVMSNRDASGGALLAIPAASKNKDLAFKFITMLYTDKTLVNMFVYGIEDVHYKKISENTITLLDSPKAYKAGNGWRFGDQFKNYLMDNEDPEKWDKFKEYNKSGLALTSLGFCFDRTPVEAQCAACKGVVERYYKQLFAGIVDVDSTVEQMENELKAAKVDEVIAEMQGQCDEWLAADGKK
jgi:putative aldouronate transport system substrate-binding protein